MPTPTQPKPQDPSQAAEQVASAHRILKELQEKIGRSHPEIGQAVEKLEEALNSLAIQTGGFL